MKRLLIAAASALMLVALASPAQADHASENFFSSTEGTTWASGGYAEVCISGDFGAYLGASQEANAIDSIVEVDSRWPSGSGSGDDTDFPASAFDLTYNTEGFCGDFDFAGDFKDAGHSDSTFCNGVPSTRRSSIQFHDPADTFEDGFAGITVTCDRAGVGTSGKIDYFVIWINKNIQDNNDFHWAFGTPWPNAGKYDFPGLLMHEWGHAIGFDSGPSGNGHMTGACAHDGTWSTMCGGSYGYYNGSESGQDGIDSRVLATHDIGETNQQY